MLGVPLLFALLSCVDSSSKPQNTENIVINVTAGATGEAGLKEFNSLQIYLNISVDAEQVLVNDVPMEPSEVTRFNFPALILDSTNGSSEFESGGLVSTVTRVMVSQNRLYSDSEEVVAVEVYSEVIQLDDKEVQQPDMCEVKILMSPNYQKLAQYTNIYPIGHSEIFRMPREHDVVVADTTNPQKAVDQLLSQTTSQYPGSQAETTQEEVAAPGKLPETPLRMDPHLLDDAGAEEDGDADGDLRRSDQKEATNRDSQSSYSAACRLVEQLRERLRLFCSKSLPVFFLVMWVVVIGVAGSAVIVKILDVFFPTCEHKISLHLNHVTLLPDEEKLVLLEAFHVEEEETAEEGEQKRP